MKMYILQCLERFYAEEVDLYDKHKDKHYTMTLCAVLSKQLGNRL